MSLEQFKEMDKVRLISLLFENQDFLNGLYQVMFWEKPEAKATKPAFSIYNPDEFKSYVRERLNMSKATVVEEFITLKASPYKEEKA